MERCENLAPKIVHVISSLGVGGAERLLVDFVASLAVDEAERTTVVVMNEADPASLGELRRSGAAVVAWDRPRGSRDPRYLLRLVSLVGPGPAVVHAHNRGSKLWGMLARVVRPRSRLVFTVHAMGVAAGYGALHRTLHNRLVDRTVAISRAVAAECAAAGLANVVTIPNGVALGRFASHSEPGSCRLEREPDRVPVIVCVARLVHAVKGQDVLIEAVARLKQRGIATRVRFVGTPSADQPETPAFLQALIARHGLAADIEVIEGVADAAPLIRDADICVVPSRQEGFGLVILEAMAAGVPVIASDIDGPRELIVPGRTGLLAPPGNPDALADAIAHMLADRAQASAMARDARAVARAHDIETMRDATLALYRGLVG